MNKYVLKIILSASLSGLIAACASTTSTGQYQSPQARLQQQMATLSTLDQKLGAAGNDTQRQQLLAEKKQAVHDSIALLKEAQAKKLSENGECIAREKNLPQSSKTCYAEESPEETQANMMVMLLSQMETGHNSQ